MFVLEMVGVVKSNRCDNCRKRKKKCDEKRPACTPCVRGGWSCPGYKSTWKFVDEAPHLAGQYAKRQYVYDTVDEDLAPFFEKYQISDLEAREMLAVQENRFFNKFNMRNFSRARSWIPRYLELNHLGSEFVFCLESNTDGELMPIRLIGAFLDYVPRRLGHNKALDDAVSCLCTIYNSRAPIPFTENKKVRRSYTKAIKSVRTHLSDPTTRMDSNVLCASILLQSFELVVNEGRGDWAVLAKGTASLIYSRGIASYKTPFDLLMFHSQLTYVLAQALNFNCDCFLTQPEWRPLMENFPTWPESVQAHSFTLRSQLCVHLADMFSLILDYRNLVSHESENDDSRPSTKAAIELLGRVKQWRQEEIIPILSISIEPLDLNSLPCYQYPDVLTGVVDSVASSMISCLHQILRSLLVIELNPPIHFTERHYITAALGDSVYCDNWQQVAGNAYNRVKGMSTMASKTLELGMEQFQIAAQTLDMDIMEQSEIVAGANVLFTGKSHGEIGRQYDSFRDTSSTESHESENRSNRVVVWKTI